VLDDRVRQDGIEAGVRERQAGAVGLEELQVAEALFAGQPGPGVAEAVDQIDGDDLGCFFGEGQRHPAAAAAHVEGPALEADAGLVEEREHLGAPVVLEERVVVLGPEAQVGVGLDGGGVDRSHVAAGGLTGRLGGGRRPGRRPADP
jgi:hypothetical protein